MIALSSVWLYEPDSVGKGVAAAGVALTALLAFTLTMPRRKTGTARTRRAGAPSSSGTE
ncbi:hypothetical protein ACFXKW_26550 [Streptomyces sp. NPDC059193]|uniref:hypothetical protein n=1 Tax=Streptomyces sp. NPDC059193 TaxID=3346763 RepID=UPI0036B455B8